MEERIPAVPQKWASHTVDRQHDQHNLLQFVIPGEERRHAQTAGVVIELLVVRNHNGRLEGARRRIVSSSVDAAAQGTPISRKRVVRFSWTCNESS